MINNEGSFRTAFVIFVTQRTRYNSETWHKNIHFLHVQLCTRSLSCLWNQTEIKTWYFSISIVAVHMQPRVNPASGLNLADSYSVQPVPAWISKVFKVRPSWPLSKASVSCSGIRESMVNVCGSDEGGQDLNFNPAGPRSRSRTLVRASSRTASGHFLPSTRHRRYSRSDGSDAGRDGTS